MQLRRSEMLLGVSALPSDCTRCDLRAPSVSRQLVSFGQAATTYTSCKCGNAFHADETLAAIRSVEQRPHHTTPAVRRRG